MEAYTDLKKTLQKKGINIINEDYYNLIDNWFEWYQGNVKDFHNYNLKMANGNKKAFERLTMNMPKKICEDFSKLIWSEKVKINLNNEENTKKMWAVLDSKKNNFSIMLPRQIEIAFALGTSGFTEYIKDGEIVIEYLNAKNIIPYKYDNFNITGICVLDQYTSEENGNTVYYTKVTYHEAVGNGYIKLNELYKSANKNELGEEVETDEEDIILENATPRFQLMKPNIANNFDIDNPMGLSIFANSIDRLKALDIKYDSFTNEFIMGKKRIAVDSSALKASPQVNEDGTISNTMYLDENDTTFVAIRGMEGQPIKDIDFNLRYDEHIKSINAELNWLSANIGLGQNYYKFDGASTKTATEIVSENSDTFRTKVSHQNTIGDCLYDLVKVVCEMLNIDTNDITFEWDDSIIIDTESIKKEALIEYNAGLINKEEYFKITRNFTDEQAKEFVAKMNAGMELKEEEPTFE